MRHRELWGSKWRCLANPTWAKSLLKIKGMYGIWWVELLACFPICMRDSDSSGKFPQKTKLESNLSCFYHNFFRQNMPKWNLQTLCPSNSSTYDSSWRLGVSINLNTFMTLDLSKSGWLDISGFPSTLGTVQRFDFAPSRDVIKNFTSWFCGLTVPTTDGDKCLLTVGALVDLDGEL